VNYTNRNANSPTSTGQLGVAYTSATLSALATAIGDLANSTELLFVLLNKKQAEHSEVLLHERCMVSSLILEGGGVGWGVEQVFKSLSVPRALTILNVSERLVFVHRKRSRKAPINLVHRFSHLIARACLARPLPPFHLLPYVDIYSTCPLFFSYFSPF
jgi:hypothetical protein